MKPSKSTIRYVAKQGYQLFMMTGKTTGTVCKLHYLVFFAANTVEEAKNGISHAKVKVYLDRNESVNIAVPKSWRELI